MTTLIWEDNLRLKDKIKIRRFIRKNKITSVTGIIELPYIINNKPYIVRTYCKHTKY